MSVQSRVLYSITTLRHKLTTITIYFFIHEFPNCFSLITIKTCLHKTSFSHKIIVGNPKFVNIFFVIAIKL